MSITFFPNIPPKMKNKAIKGGFVILVNETTTLFPPVVD
jgi:hypothetical protein